jgi:hypothetical protein
MFFPFFLLGFLFLLIVLKIAFSKFCKNASAAVDKHNLLNRAISLFLVGTGSLYTFLSSTALSPFGCTSIGKSQFVVTKSPNIACYEGEWKRYLPIAIIFAVLYLVCFPLGVLVLLVRNRSETNTPLFQQKYGHFVNGYRWSYSYWYVVVLLKNLSISLLMQYLSANQNESSTNFATVIVLFVFVLLNLICMPFRQIGDTHRACVLKVGPKSAQEVNLVPQVGTA